MNSTIFFLIQKIPKFSNIKSGLYRQVIRLGSGGLEVGGVVIFTPGLIVKLFEHK